MALLLRYALAITEQMKCWELLVQKIERFRTLCSTQQQHERGCAKERHATCNIQQCRELLNWPAMLRPFAPGFL